MSATNSTPNLHLPLFVGTDKPSWMGDVNGAMTKIDARFVTDESAVATINATVLTLQTSLADALARIATLEGGA